MYYTAIQYVRVGKRVYTPGEIITDEMTRETTERLVRKGAIWGEMEIMPLRNVPEPPQEAAGAPEEPEATEYQAEDDDEEQRLLMGDLVKKTERRKRR